MADDLRLKIINLAHTQLGKPYLQDEKFDCSKTEQAHFDCSSFTQWCYFQGAGILLPRTAHEQFPVLAVTINPKQGDLGFFRDEERGIYHVGIVFDESQVIEARGDPYNAVIFRPASVWAKWKNFAGWRTHPQLT